MALTTFIFTSCSWKDNESSTNLIGEDIKTWNVTRFQNDFFASDDTLTTINLSDIIPFRQYKDKTIQFHQTCAIQAFLHPSGTYYIFTEHGKNIAPFPPYCVPVAQGKIVSVRGQFWHKNHSISTARIDALIEFKTPYLNQGNPIYLSYNWYKNETKQNQVLEGSIKRAPWELDSPNPKRSINRILRAAENYYKTPILGECHDKQGRTGT